MEHTLKHMREQVLDAGASGTPLRLRGGASKDWYGNAARGAVLDTRAHRGIVAYDPTELVLTARCGTPLAEIDAALAEHGQMLAFEPPHFGPGATLGGMFASGLSGPRRQAAGALRDFVLGARLMDGHGELLRFGGQVMKNVAGYDVARMLAGSLGTLGLVAEVSLKVMPLPFAQTTLQLAMGQQQALDTLDAWAGQPLPVSASAWHDGVLMLRLSGARAAVNAARRQIGGELLDDAGPRWRALREQTHPFFAAAGPAPLWRLALPAATAAQALPWPQLLEWGGTQRWFHSPADGAQLHAMAAELGGHACRFRGAGQRSEVFQPLAPAVMAIHANLKRKFDPAGIFNPGRMYQEL
ncbi:MAG: glycolate oxidase subunit GlcE [Pseudomonadota bacterium]